MGSTHSGPPSRRRAMIEDSTEVFHTTSSRGGGSDLPSPRWLGVGAPPTPVRTTTGAGAMTGHQPLLRPMVHSSRGATSACPCWATQRRAGDSAMVEHTCRQVNNGHNLTTQAITARAFPRGGEDPNGDFATTTTRAKGVAPSANLEETQAKAIVAKTLSTLPPPSTDRVNRMYRQLSEIHAIVAMPLAECTHWWRSNQTSSPVWAGTSPRGPIVEPFMARMVPLPPTNFSS
jgi:hypothetical protein